MSKYTTEVRFICEQYAGVDESAGFSKVYEIIETARPKVFDFDFPIFDENYRSVLETKILKHYYTREIGAETVGLWKFWLETRLNEIMPYYNKLYETTLLSFNPLLDTDITTNKDGTLGGNKTESGTLNSTTHTDTSESNSSSGSVERKTDGTDSSHTGATSAVTGTNADNDWDMYSDTPQGGINGLDSNTYLTNARHNTRNNNSSNSGTSESTTNNTNEQNVDESRSGSYDGSGEVDSRSNQTSGNSSNFNNTESWVEHITGKRGTASYSKMLQEFRDTILNIDVAIITDLSDLFMGIW